MNETPASNRIHIGFFGRRNAGKSSVVNAVTNQDLSVVSDVKGTTTDPVTKAMELLPLGPVLIIDTPGFDDEGELGELRIKKTKQILNKTDIAVLVVDATEGLHTADSQLISLFKNKNTPYLLVYNKCDLLSVSDMKKLSEDTNAMLVSAKDKKNIEQLKEKLGLLVDVKNEKLLIGDKLKKGDTVILVTPIDESAPKARMILPQQMMIRDVLDADCKCIVVKETELAETFSMLKENPALVITDSQAFHAVAGIVPKEIPLTSFSILMARYKGFLETAVNGAMSIDTLADGDTVLIAEGCTHHRQCNDIGTVKLPKWITEYTGKKLNFEFSSGGEFPEDVSKYALVVHCGGCMLNEREVLYRMKCTVDQGVAFTNYGTTIALTQGILMRSLELFKGKYK